MNLYDLNEKSKVAIQNGFTFNRINKLTIKYCSHLRYVNTGYYLKFQIPMCHRQISRVISQTWKNVENFRTDVENRFHFACQKKLNQLHVVF